VVVVVSVTVTEAVIVAAPAVVVTVVRDVEGLRQEQAEETREAE
jgi:hypothetical protein